MYFILVEKNGCLYNDLKQSDNLLYQHKEAFKHRLYKDIQYAFVIDNNDFSESVININILKKLLSKKFKDFNCEKFLSSI